MTHRTALIPVIDLMGGQVVRGVGGQRSTYQPIVSALCRSSDPLIVGRTLTVHCGASRLYLADLDALMGGRVQTAVLKQLLQALPAVHELWLDGGFEDAAAAAEVARELGELASRVLPVYGSESLRSRAALADCFVKNPQAVLSLDRRGNERLDPAGCWDAPELWPQRVIVMTLERVGSGHGPDLQTLTEVQARAPAAQLVGAGGLRSLADLQAADAAGAAGWLVASALHDLQLPRVADSASC
jgi:phosphoribosylformimino-5-aminoimidazole carboxamide ribotide isomerase